MMQLLRKNCFKWMIIILLSTTYLNRGLFISASGTETLATASESNKNEFNSLLELAIYLFGGGQNDIDEDGDNPETYGAFAHPQPIICEAFTEMLSEPSLHIENRFLLFDESLIAPAYFPSIEHPPQSL